MSPLVFAILVFLWWVLCKLVFRRVRNDYRIKGRISVVGLLLECAVFFVHAQLLGLLYWDIPIGSFVDVISFSYYMNNWPSLTDSPILLAIGITLAIVGSIMLLMAWGVFASPGRVTGLKVDRLRTNGVYRLTRNPQVLGYGLLLAAFPLIWNPSGWSWVYAAIVVVVYWPGVHTMVMIEEGHLLRTFGDAYARYTLSCPRYLRLRWSKGLGQTNPDRTLP